ncbi:MAG TPA: polysaccharide biosynthesis protein [Lactobacillaceae bacterium]|jgi:O-antigen/teichoic acid export membrane protein
MTDETKTQPGGRVKATQVNGQILTAEEILAQAQLRLQARQQSEHVAEAAPQVQTTQQPVQQHQWQAPRAQVADVVAQEPPIEEAPLNTQATLVKGSAWLSAGSMVSRLLGALYIIPWMAMLGMYANRGNALFAQGYTIYAIFLMIATAGIPTAISKLVAQFNTMQEGRVTRRLLRQSSLLGIVMGLLAGLVIYFGAPVLAGGNAKLVPVLHSLAPAVALFPVMSIWRGYFQGHQLMNVSALSQIVEQIARVAYMLIAAVVVLRMDKDNWTQVVVQSTFAAFIGAIFSMAVLVWGWAKYDKFFTSHVRNAQNKLRISTRQLLRDVLKEAWPFIIIGSAINLFQLVDQYTFFGAMNHFFNYSQTSLDNQFALFSANPNKIIMIIVPFATAIAGTALPMLSGANVNPKLADIQQQLRQMFKLFAVIMVPSALGMFAIARPLYITFYQNLDPIATRQGVYLLQYSSIMALFFALFMLIAFALQGLSDTRIVLRAFGFGLLVKIAVQVPLIFYFQMMGPLVASVIGMIFAIAYMLDFMRRTYDVSLGDVIEDLGKLLTGAIVMALVAGGLAAGLAAILPDTQFVAALIAVLSAGVGGIVTAMIYLRLGYGADVLGSRVKRLPKWLRG